MRSIRNSLIVYFVILLTGALGAVSWTSYQMTEQSLREQQRESRARITSQCEANCTDARADLDRRILGQANNMANIARSMVVHAEGHFALFAMIGSGALPMGYLNVGMIGFQAGNEDAPDKSKLGMKTEIWKYQPLSTHVADADGFVADEDGTHAQEYFQIYRGNGYPIQRSASLEDQSFTLDRDLRRSLVLHAEHFDDVEMENGVKIRRVTLKAPVSDSGFLNLRWPARMAPPITGVPTFRPSGGVWPPLAGKKKLGKGGFGPPQQGKSSVFTIRTNWFYIQFASDTGLTEAKIAGFQNQRDEQLAQVDQTIDADLAHLRSRFFWICFLTVAAVWVGGFGVIRLGLAPLAKMSDAVSQVSAKNFHLRLDPNKLPEELQPIAARIEATLEELQKAFTREKQAAADISHELRTPLAALMTNLEVGLRKPRSAEEYREILEESCASGQHMYQLVERLLTLARLDAGADVFRPADVDVIDTAVQCADLIGPLARARGIDLRLHSPEPVTTVTDPNKLREVLTNLLHNAVEYNKPNGAIDLSIERVNGHVRFEVRDTGIGISPEALEHIFERFYRADPSRQADTPHAGLGLSIVKSYINLMGGVIRVESGEAGTTFTIELPFVAPQPDLATAVQPALELAHR